jgi:hypothetical protein
MLNFSNPSAGYRASSRIPEGFDKYSKGFTKNISNGCYYIPRLYDTTMSNLVEHATAYV